MFITALLKEIDINQKEGRRHNDGAPLNYLFLH